MKLTQLHSNSRKCLESETKTVVTSEKTEKYSCDNDSIEKGGNGSLTIFTPQLGETFHCSNEVEVSNETGKKIKMVVDIIMK